MSALSAQARVRAFFTDMNLSRLGVAVSGGSDSLALLSLLNDWRGAGGPELNAVTVDHGLRADAAREATMVADICTDWGIPHDTLRWQGWDGRGNLPAEARRARYGLMAEWAEKTGIHDIAIAHTVDDQAETFLMRLSREAGLDGLAAMVPSWKQGGVTFHRPTLGCTRAELRDHLTARGLTWVEDPSNEDPIYDRARARQALRALEPLGLDAQTLASTARHLRAAQNVVEAEMWRAARAIAHCDAGDVIIDRAAFADLPVEIARRLLQEALLWIGGGEYPPRSSALRAAKEALKDGQTTTLSGCLLLSNADHIRITREPQAVKTCINRPGEVWDGRWRLTGPENVEQQAEIRALGEAGLAQCPDWRSTARPAAALYGSPAVWIGETLLAAPLAGLSQGWGAELIPRPRRDFAAALSD